MKDPEFLARMRKLPCMACGAWNRTEAHHIKTRGAGGGDQAFNILPLCPDCHTQAEYAWHRSKEKFFEKFPDVKDHMKDMGWDFIGTKLIHKGFRKVEGK